MNIDDIVKQARRHSRRGASAVVRRLLVEAADAVRGGGGFEFYRYGFWPDERLWIPWVPGGATARLPTLGLEKDHHEH
jgi:hypothetical protein